MDCLAAELVLSSCFSDSVFVTLFRTAALVETAISGVDTGCFALAGALHRLNTVVVLAMADGLFGTERWDELLIGTRPPPPPPFHFPNNRRSSEIQGTALGKCQRAWSCIYIYIYIGPCLRV